MALIGAVGQISSLIGTATQLAGTLFQRQITIRDKNNTDNQVILNVTDSENLEFAVDITEKPVADLGASTDYISRKSTPLTLTGVISNKNVDLLVDPIEFITSQAGSFAPELISGINQSVSFASEFYDNGLDEIDKKLKILRRWQLEGTILEVIGARLDATKIHDSEEFNYLIERFTPVSDKQNGDTVGFTIVLKNFLNLQDVPSATKQGSTLQEESTVSVDSDVNPFEAPAA